MVEPTLKDLRSKAHSLGGAYGQAKTAEARRTAQHDLTLAKMAYRTAKFIDECEAPFTQEDADYICSVIASRVGGGE